MKRDAIEKIEELALKANAVITPYGEQRGVYYLRDSEGNLQRHEAQLDPLGATFQSIHDFVSVLDGNVTGTVFVNDSGAVTIAESSTARWAYRLPLPVHPVFALLESMKDGTTFDQKGLVRLLRTRLNGYVPESVIENLRNLKVTASSDSGVSITHGNRFIDASIKQQAAQKDGAPIPEQFVFSVPVFDLPELVGQLKPVTVLLEVEPAERAEGLRFVLLARHDDLRAARQDMLEDLQNRLEGHENLPPDVLVLRGAPDRDPALKY